MMNRLILLISIIFYTNIHAKEVTPVNFASDITKELARINKDPRYLSSEKKLKKYIKNYATVVILFQDESFMAGDFKETFLTGKSNKKVKRNFFIYFLSSKIFKRYPLEIRLKITKIVKKYIDKNYWEETFTLYNIISTEHNLDKVKDVKKQIETLKFLTKNYEEYKELYIYNKGDVKAHYQPDIWGEFYIDLMKFDLEGYTKDDTLLDEYTSLVRKLYTKSRKDIKYYNPINVQKVLKDKSSTKVHGYFKGLK